VAALTNQAMGGSMPFEVALAKRLEIVKPSLQQVNDFLDTEPPILTPGIVELIAELHNKNKKVYLVSGGFRQLIYPVADMVGISHEHVYANNLLFNQDGTYAGFDDSELTAWSGGKSRVMEELQKLHGDPLIMVGDGATDVEARPPATAVIGFGGNVVRESVKNDADWFVHDFDKMVQEL
jgi:phosphoserine phosphatase